uniref:Alpha-L-rhamnosidase n=1 Tax=Acidobacterium capsulatum TaxID=33075 RepID=A0A7V4XQU7_9BACT
MKRWVVAALLVAASIAGAQSVAPMGDPANGPSKIPDAQLDPARNLPPSALESARHHPLPEHYIWTKADAVPEQPSLVAGWNSGSSEDLRPHYFRRVFEVAGVPSQATLYVAGPREAKIYLNGQQVGHFQLSLDSQLGIRVYACDVSHALRAGRNVLAIEAVRGPNVGSGAEDRRGVELTHGEVLAAMIVPAARGLIAQPLVMSDARWRATLHPVAGNWMLPSFKDATWPLVDDLGGLESSINFFQWNADAGMYAWPGYDGISPFLAHYSLRPMRVEGVYDGLGRIQNASSLVNGSDTDLHVTLPARDVMTQNAPQMVLDFGREVTGRLELISASDGPAEVTVQYGESKDEALHGPWLGSDPIYVAPHSKAYGPKSAFRYAVVRFTGGRDVRFHSIRLDGIAYPVKYQGYFESSDAELNKMWQVGAYTAHLCMQDDIWDAPKRDRGRWIGDLDVSGRTIDDVFADHFLMEDTLNRLLGPDPVKAHVNGIPGYSALWVTTETQYYLHAGSVDQLRKIHARLVELLAYMEKDLNQQHLFVDATHAWPFVDWSPRMHSDTPQTRMATQFEYYAAFRDGEYLLNALHDRENAARFGHVADELREAAQQHLLDSQGSFGDRWQPNAYAVVSGVAGPEQHSSIWRSALSGVGQHLYHPYIITPYYNYYVVSAMAKMGHRRAALAWIRKFWGGMIDEGATSYWEGYDPSWYKGSLFHRSLQADNETGFHTSLAHGWSSGVTPWLMEQVLGIQPTAAGFSQVRIRPDLIGLRWAKGGEPTPHGLLSVSIRNDHGCRLEITLPSGVEASVLVPVSGTNQQVMVNGRPVSSTSAESGRRAIIALRGQGRYVITAH